MPENNEGSNLTFSDLIDKTVLVGITYLDSSGEFLQTEQFFGKIISADKEDGIILQLGTDEKRWIPPDLSNLERADPAEYRLKNTNEVVVDPDYISIWTVQKPNRPS